MAGGWSRDGAVQEQIDDSLVRISFLAPDILVAILEGRQPGTLTRQKLARIGPAIRLGNAAQGARVGRSAADAA